MIVFSAVLLRRGGAEGRGAAPHLPGVGGLLQIAHLLPRQQAPQLPAILLRFRSRASSDPQPSEGSRIGEAASQVSAPSDSQRASLLSTVVKNVIRGFAKLTKLSGLTRNFFIENRPKIVLR